MFLRQIFKNTHFGKNVDHNGFLKKHYSCMTLNLASINMAMWLTELYLILVYQNMIFKKDKTIIKYK